MLYRTEWGLTAAVAAVAMSHVKTEINKYEGHLVPVT